MDSGINGPILTFGAFGTKEILIARRNHNPQNFLYHESKNSFQDTMNNIMTVLSKAKLLD